MKNISLIILLLLNSCYYLVRHDNYIVKVYYVSGYEETIKIKDSNGLLLHYGCLYSSNMAIRCGVREFKVISKN